MGWVARSRMRPRPVRSERQLRHPISTLIIGLAGFLLFAAIAVVSNVFANATTSWWTTGIFVGFALMALPITGDYFAARHEVSEEGLRYGRLIGSGGLLRWDEVKSVRYMPRHEMVSPRIAVWRGGPSIRHVDGTAGLRDATSRACAVGRDRSGDPIDFAGYG